MPSNSVSDKLKHEYDRFCENLASMLKEHEGEFALLKNDDPIRFFPSYDEGYKVAIEEFGSDAEFLIQEICDRPPESVSISWELGLAFG